MARDLPSLIPRPHWNEVKTSLIPRPHWNEAKTSLIPRSHWNETKTSLVPRPHWNETKTSLGPVPDVGVAVGADLFLRAQEAELEGCPLITLVLHHGQDGEGVGQEGAELRRRRGLKDGGRE